MTDRHEAKRLHSLRERYRRIEAPRSLSAAVLAEVNRSFDAGQTTRWPWWAAGAVAALATILIVPVYLSDDTGEARKKTGLKVPGLSALQGHIPSVADMAMPGLSSLRALPPVRTMPSIPPQASDPERSPQSNTPVDYRQHNLTLALQMEVTDDEQAQI